MKKFIIGYGLGGGFGGINSYEVIETINLEDAEQQAYNKSCEEYDQLAGMHGLQDESEIMEEEECGEAEARFLYEEQRESWLDYVTYEYSEEMEKELSAGYHFHNPFKD